MSNQTVTNATENGLEKIKKIAISELTVGMYVLSIFTKNKTVSIKSEGYILKTTSIEQLVKAHVNYVNIDPSKTKQNATAKNETKNEKTVPITQQSPSIKPDIANPTVAFSSEIQKASKLYNKAKALQKRVLRDVANNTSINTDVVKQSTDAIVDSIFRNEDALSCMSRLRVKDDYLIEHSLNVSILMSIFCKHMNLEREIMEALALGAFLHDVGKTLIPKEILYKPGKYTEAEYKIMKSHVPLGIKVLENTKNIPDIALTVIKQHHERLDGSGYPNNKKEEDISQYGRMIAIVDSYDAMISDKTYKKGIHPVQAFKSLVKDSPQHYDLALVEKFINCLGVYPIGTLVQLESGKIGLISKINRKNPLKPFVRVFYNTRLNQAIAMEELNLSKSKYNDQIHSCVKPEEFNLNLIKFFTSAFLEQ